MQTMVIRDEDRSSWDKGNYRLVIYCVGSGTLYTHFTIGGPGNMQQIPPCTDEITTGAVDLAVPADAVGMSVIIVPAGDVQAAVAYQVQRHYSG